MPSEKYEYIRAFVQVDGELHWEYKVEGNYAQGCLKHDEDVSSWTEEEIIDCTAVVLFVDEEQYNIIEVIYV